MSNPSTKNNKPKKTAKNDINITISINDCGAFGTAVRDDIVFAFSLRQQIRGSRYLYRGRVSALMPDGITVMEYTGAARSKVLRNNPDAAKTAKTKYETLKIWTNIYSNSIDEQTVRACVEKAVQKLWLEHAASIIRCVENSVSPATITPVIAGALYLEDFLKSQGKKRNWSVNSYKAYYSGVRLFLAELPSAPMCKVSTKDVAKTIEKYHLKGAIVNIVRKFWQWCIESGKCTGKNPVPQTEKKIKNPKKKQLQAEYSNVLDATQLEKLRQILLVDGVKDSRAVGGAIILYGGFSAEFVCGLRWKDILFDGDYPDYVRVVCIMKDSAGATHNYTRPLLLQGAEILRSRYAQLLEDADGDFTRIQEYPIVALEKTPKKPLGEAELTEYIRVLLHKIGVPKRAFQAYSGYGKKIGVRFLRNSYRYIVENSCGLENEPGTVLFLEGESLIGDTTSDNYTSFADEAGQWRLYRHLRQADIQRKVDTPPDEIVNDQEVHYFGPDNNKHRAIVRAMVVLRPGERMILDVPQGVRGSIRAERTVDE